MDLLSAPGARLLRTTAALVALASLACSHGGDPSVETTPPAEEREDPDPERRPAPREISTDRAHAEDPGAGSAARRASQGAVEEGKGYLIADRLREAAARFERATRIDPTNGFAWYWLGVARFEAGDRRGAAGVLEKAESLLGPYPEWRAKAARLLEGIRQEAAIDATRQRARMVERQIAGRGVRDPRVLDAMRAVPRHEFVPPEYLDLAYADQPLPIGHGQTISQPYIVAYMTEALELSPEDRVLEIGAGCGYQTAVLAEIAREVYSIEIVPSLARRAARTLRELGVSNARVIAADGRRGWPRAAPFDANLLAAAPAEVPDALLGQLAEGGRLVAPVGRGATQRIRRWRRRGDRLEEEDLIAVRFVPLTRDEEG